MVIHHCHWPGCPRRVPPAMWGCKPHWFKLPKFLRDLVWDAYVPGQEITKTPSKRYVAIARIVQMWIEATQAPIIQDGQGGLRPLTDEEIRIVNDKIKQVLKEEGVM